MVVKIGISIKECATTILQKQLVQKMDDAPASSPYLAAAESSPISGFAPLWAGRSLVLGAPGMRVEGIINGVVVSTLIHFCQSKL